MTIWRQTKSAVSFSRACNVNNKFILNNGWLLFKSVCDVEKVSINLASYYYNGTKKEVNVIPDVQVSLYFNSITAVFCIL